MGNKNEKGNDDAFIIAIILAFILVMYLSSTRVVNFEIQGKCTSGFVGIDYKSNYNGTDLVPEYLNLKNIDGMECIYKIKGSIPKDKLNKILEQND